MRLPFKGDEVDIELVKRYPRERYVLTTKLSDDFMHSEEEQARV